VKFLHLANHGSRNVGNGALILGLERVLREDLSVAPSFEPEPWDEYSVGRRRFDESFVERVNRDSDALLVGAAVTFDGRPPYAATGMRFDLPLDLWPQIRKPIVFYGLSHRDWRHRGNYHHLERLRLTLETMVAAPNVLLSVRNDGTKQWLERLTGVASAKILEVPDPAVYVPVTDASHPEIENDKANVILALNDEITTTLMEELDPSKTPDRRAGWRPRGWGRLSRLWTHPSAWETASSAIHREIVYALRTLATERELNVIMCVHDPSDIWATGDFVRQLASAERSMCVLAASGLSVPRTPLFYDLYAKSDVAISLRVHSMNPAIGIGVPVVPVLSQDRMRVFMRDAGLAPLCADVRDPGLSDAIVQRVRAALERPDEARATLEAARISLRERTAGFNQVVEQFVTA
jgi:hypothetical protein